MAEPITYAQQLLNAQAAAATAKAARDAWKPEDLPETATAQERSLRTMMQNVPGLATLGNPHAKEVKAAEDEYWNLIKGHLQGQLKQQASGYGFGWKGNKSEDYHSGRVAELLRDKGITDLGQIGYSEDGKNLINKETGAVVPWHEGKKGSQEGQIGWSAKGKGRTNYMVQKDAQGNPVFFPKWKSNAPGGIGGFLLKAAPIAATFIPGMQGWGSALLSAGLTGLQGGGLGDILKSGAISYAAGELGGEANALAKGAASGLSPAMQKLAGNLAQGATQSAVRGAATGNLDLGQIATGALAGGVAGGIANALSPEQLPAGQAGPVAPGAGSVTGIAAIDRAIPGIAGRTASDVLVRGKDVGEALTGSALNAASQEVIRQLPSTGYGLGDAILRGGVQMGAKEIAGALNAPSAPSRAAPRAQQSQDALARTMSSPQSQDALASTYRALLPFLQARSQGQAQQVASVEEFEPLDVQKLFARTSLYARGGNVATKPSIQQLLAQLRSSGKIA